MDSLAKNEWRTALHEQVGGRCFYCWAHISLGDEPLPRDWLRVRYGNRMVVEHTSPTIRGGVDHISNYVPSCQQCNSEKATMTLSEFEFVSGLRRGNLSFTFPLMMPKIPRDWLCVHSKQFERQLLIANFPRGQLSS